MRRARGTDGSLLPSLPWTLASLALALAPHVPYLPVWILAAFVGCGAWRYSIERRRAPIPSAWFRGALALACFLGVLFTYMSISGVGPGSALLSIMASLKILETRRRRDQFVLLFIAVFLVMASLLREQYLWSLPYLVVALIFILTAWLRISSEPSESIRRSFGTAARMIGYAAPIAIAMWIFFPRVATPFWAVPIDTSSGTSGLSDTMSPGDISSLSMSNAVAFRVRFDGAVPAPRDRYWRGLVLHRFDGRRWTGSDPGRRSVEDQLEVSGEPVRYQVTMEPTRQQYLFALDMPYTWQADRGYMGRFQELARVLPVDQRFAYSVESYTEYKADAGMPRYFRNWFIDLPEGRNPRTARLAREMFAANGSTGGYIDAVLSMFHEQEFYYTLQPPALGADPIDKFLFDTRQGFCEHYASAFTVMMRAAGIPARVVLGYQGGELNPFDDYLIVRQSDAHAWSEVWFDGAGWVRVDPTAAVAPERIEVGFTDSLFDGLGAEWGLAAPSLLLHRMRLYWDSLNARWNDWILGYGPDKQNQFMRFLGMDDPTWRRMFLTLICACIALVLLVSGFLMLRYRPPKPDRAARLYAKFVHKTGVQPKTGETPLAFAERVNGHSRLPEDTVDAVTSAYLDARYGTAPLEALRQLETQVAAIR